MLALWAGDALETRRAGWRRMGCPLKTVGMSVCYGTKLGLGLWLVPYSVFSQWPHNSHALACIAARHFCCWPLTTPHWCAISNPWTSSAHSTNKPNLLLTLSKDGRFLCGQVSTNLQGVGGSGTNESDVQTHDDLVIESCLPVWFDGQT